MTSKVSKVVPMELHCNLVALHSRDRYSLERWCAFRLAIGNFPAVLASARARFTRSAVYRVSRCSENAEGPWEMGTARFHSRQKSIEISFSLARNASRYDAFILFLLSLPVSLSRLSLRTRDVTIAFFPPETFIDALWKNIEALFDSDPTGSTGTRIFGDPFVRLSRIFDSTVAVPTIFQILLVRNVYRTEIISFSIINWRETLEIFSLKYTRKCCAQGSTCALRGNN